MRDVTSPMIARPDADTAHAIAQRSAEARVIAQSRKASQQFDVQEQHREGAFMARPIFPPASATALA